MIEEILKLAEDQEELTAYSNKFMLHELKRLFRAVKKVDSPEKPKKFGFYKNLIKQNQGNKENQEKILKEVFGNRQELSPNDLMNDLKKYNVPQGEQIVTRPETGYQTTQRLISDKEKNKTLNATIFGSILKKIIDKYQHQEGFKEIFDSINLLLGDHFSDSAAFVRYTKISNDWIHFDAFQTDFFNSLKAKIKDSGGLEKSVMSDFRKHEEEFYKVAVSKIVRTSGAKIFTANTPEIVKKVENVQGEVKLSELYHKLPKKLGFRLIKISDLFKKFDTRPGPKAEFKKKIFAEPFTSKSAEPITQRQLVEFFTEVFRELENFAGDKISKEELNGILEELIDDKFEDFDKGREIIKIIFHSLLDDIKEALDAGINELRSYLYSDKLVEKIQIRYQNLAKEREEKEQRQKLYDKNIWWAARGMIFENENSFLGAVNNILFEEYISVAQAVKDYFSGNEEKTNNAVNFLIRQDLKEVTDEFINYYKNNKVNLINFRDKFTYIVNESKNENKRKYINKLWVGLFPHIKTFFEIDYMRSKVEPAISPERIGEKYMEVLKKVSPVEAFSPDSKYLFLSLTRVINVKETFNLLLQKAEEADNTNKKIKSLINYMAESEYKLTGINLLDLFHLLKKRNYDSDVLTYAAKKWMRIDSRLKLEYNKITDKEKKDIPKRLKL